jgi:putative Holliday junction resolvase
MPGTPEPGAPGGIVLLAFDYGARRIGVAVGQTTTGTASPVGTLSAESGPDWQAIARLLRDWGPRRLLVGLPCNMDGSDTVLTAECRRFADELARRTGLPVELVDERLTSVAAIDELREARRSGAMARRVSRGDVDANAARLILETWLGGRSVASGSGNK